jgi:outer membrane protein assembly factor BamA
VIAALLFALAAAAPQAPVEKIAEVRVHGNATLNDETVIRLAGIAIGDALAPSGLDAIEKRLKDSGRFDEVQVRKRYRTLAMDEVALVLVVHEKPGISPTGEPPSTIKRLRSHLMFFPIFRYDDGYGFTYGAQTAVVDAIGKGTRLSVPLSWGGTRRAAVELDRTFRAGPLTRLTGSFGITQRENPFYDVDDRRTEGSVRAERRLFTVAVLGADVGRTAVTFAPAHDDFWSTAADATLDTRRDPSYPVDAVYGSVRWQRLVPLGGTTFSASTLDKYRFDVRGYKRLVGQNVIAVHAEYDTASAPLPPYEQWLLGGSSLRGEPPGAFAGDQRLLWSAELRVPFSSPLNVAGRTGFNFFMDGGRIAAHGDKISSTPQVRGVGAGLFINAAVLNLNFEVAHSLDGRGTKFHFGTGFTF